MSIEQQVFQQFKGPMSEVAHAITKLVISQEARGSTSLGGIADSAMGALGGVGVAARNVAANFGGGKRFELQINPEKYERNYEVKYNSPPRQGAAAPTQHFQQVLGEMLTVSFTLDGTGVVPASLSDVGNWAKAQLSKTIGVTDVSYVTNRIKELKEVIGEYDNSTHEPPLVSVAWGDVEPFRGRMEKMAVTYTLFHPSGIPLRAEITLTFKENRAVEAAADEFQTEVDAASARPNSPDMTHRHTVTESDTLPLLTQKIYQDSRYYWQVAQSNGLTHFRKLRINSELYFPPLDRSTPGT